MAKNNNPKQVVSAALKSKVIKRIAFTGIIGVIFFVGLNWYIYPTTYTWGEALFQAVIFSAVWWGVQMLLNYRIFFSKDR